MKLSTKELYNISNKIRIELLKAIYEAKSGHPGGSLSAAEILTTLYFDEMNINPQDPKMEGRDRFVLSKGHAAPVLYATLGERGYFPVEDIRTLRKIDSHFQGHPNMDKVAGVEMSTGSLGQGISAAVGMALAARVDKNGARVYALLGDGELQEGIVWEAFMAAAHYKLSNLCAFIDWNGLQIDGENDKVMKVTPIDAKLKAFGWNVLSIDGHDIDSIKKALKEAKEYKEGPTAIIAKTHKGQGVSFMTDEAGWHGKAPSEDELNRALEEIGGRL